MQLPTSARQQWGGFFAPSETGGDHSSAEASGTMLRDVAAQKGWGKWNGTRRNKPKLEQGSGSPQDPGPTCSARASMGVMYTQRPSEFWSNILRMANSAQMVFPLPVGAPTNTLSSLL